MAAVVARTGNERQRSTSRTPELISLGDSANNHMPVSSAASPRTGALAAHPPTNISRPGATSAGLSAGAATPVVLSVARLPTIRARRPARVVPGRWQGPSRVLLIIVGAAANMSEGGATSSG